MDKESQSTHQVPDDATERRIQQIYDMYGVTTPSDLQRAAAITLLKAFDEAIKMPRGALDSRH